MLLPLLSSLQVYVFCHITTGLLLGLLFYACKRDRLLVAACVTGAALLLIAGVAALRWNRKSRLLVLALGCGVLSHQTLDAMWFEPAAWFWPVPGPFPPPDQDIPILSYFLANLLQPAEWLFAAAFLLHRCDLPGDTGALDKDCSRTPAAHGRLFDLGIPLGRDRLSIRDHRVGRPLGEHDRGTRAPLECEGGWTG